MSTNPPLISQDTKIKVEDESIGSKVKEVQALKCSVYTFLSIATIPIAWALLFIFVEFSLNAAGEAFDDLVQTITYIIMMAVVTFASFFGLWFTHRYGGIAQQARILKAASEVLRAGAEIFNSQINDLDAQIGNLENLTINKVRGTQDLLAGVVLECQAIGELTQSIKGNDAETTQFIDDVHEILALIKILQRQISKNELMQLFYQVANDDNEEGLSKEEYLKYLDRLNKETADAFREEFKSWKKMDKNRNGKIDANEFEDGLNKIFDNLDRKDREIINQRR